MRTFVLQTYKNDIKIALKYNENDRLIAFEVEGEISILQLDWWYSNMPYCIDGLELFKKSTKKKFKVIEVQLDISFEAFWMTYNHKVGNKSRSRRLYEKLTDIEKQEVFINIKQYDNYLAIHPNQDKCYPETYLAQRRFENQYKF